MKNRICIIVCYMGKIPNYYNMWVKSVKYNRNYDFMLITDDTSVEYSKEVPNLTVKHMSFQEVIRLACVKLNVDIRFDKPYKLCDLRPMYGSIFSEFLYDYHFWGHCDIDMMFGNLDSFVTDEICNTFCKIYELGHLTLYKNNDYGNSIYRLSGWGNWEDVTKNNMSMYFDEVGIRQKCSENKINVYTRKDYADISPRHKRFTLSNDLLTKEQKRNNNYKYQCFYWERGHVYRAYYEDCVVKIQEFNYIHYQKRKIMQDYVGTGSAFFITYRGFLPKEYEGIPMLKEVKKYNKYPGMLFETIENIIFWIKEYKKRLMIKIRRYIK